jgi:Fic family protein
MAAPIRTTGTYRPHTGGYNAFHPAPLPLDPPLAMSRERIRLLSEADRAVAGLDSVTDLLPDPDGFVYSYVRREAVLSSQIEGTQSSLDDLVRREAGAQATRRGDAGEVSNYVAALNESLRALHELPVSVRLIRQAHERLMQGVRGANRTPGALRTHQVHIGPEGAGIADAIFVPPPPEAVPDALAALEAYIHADEDGDPPLLRIGIAHAQFETIHPFGDGNGRCGRLLVSLLLAEKRLLRRPVLYLSLFFRRHRQEYYERLQATRDSGDYEGWIDFFLRGVIEVAADARDRARGIVEMRETHRARIVEAASGNPGHAFRLLDDLFRRPHVSINAVAGTLGVTFPTAARLVETYESLGILHEITGQQRNRIYVHKPYIDLFSDR